MKWLKQIPVILMCIMCSYYLTWIIDKITITTSLQYMMVFIYFFAVCIGMVLLYKKFLKPNMHDKNKIVKYCIVSCVLAGIILGGCFSFWVNKYPSTTIGITAMGNTGEYHKDQNGTEVWITDIILDGKLLDLSRVETVPGWEYRESVLVSYKNQPATIKINLPGAKHIEIAFESHAWCGTVQIQDGSNIQTIDLFNIGNSKPVIYTVESNKPTSLTVYDTLAAICCYVLLVACFYMLFAAAVRWKKAVGLPFGLLFFLFIFVSNIFHLNVYTTLALLLTGAAIVVMVPDALEDPKMLKYFKSKNLVFIFLAALYGAFVLVGHRLIENEIDISIIQEVCLYLLCVLNFIWMMGFILYVLELISDKMTAHVSIKNQPLIFYAIPCMVIWTVYLLAFYPGLMSPDSIDQWQQMTTFKFVDSHPAFHTLINWLITRLWFSPAAIALANIIFLSLVYADGMVVLEKLGISKCILMVITILFSISPVNGMMSISIWKDIPYSISLLWLTVLFLKIIVYQESWLKNFKNQILITVAICFVILFRHNGIVPGIAALIGLMIFIKENRIRIVKITLAVFIIIFIIKIPVYNYLNVTPPASRLNIILPLHQVQFMVTEKVALSPKEQYLLDQICPFELWGESYNKYISTITHNPKFNNNVIASSKNEFIKIWINLALENPTLVIKDWLGLTSLIWQIKQPIDGYIGTVCRDIGQNDLELKSTTLLPALQKYINYYVSNSEKPKKNWFIWRPALYFYLICLFGFSFIHRTNIRSLIIMLPVVFNALGLFISIPAQDVRYLYSTLLIAPIIISTLFIPSTMLEKLK